MIRAYVSVGSKESGPSITGTYSQLHQPGSSWYAAQLVTRLPDRPGMKIQYTTGNEVKE